MATSELMRRRSGKCPAGHDLVSWKAKAGHCDGCGNMVYKDDFVMDCRTCNWYLCARCHPQEPPSFWGGMTQYFSDMASEAAMFLPEMSCGAPSRDSLTVDEIDCSQDVVDDFPASKAGGKKFVDECDECGKRFANPKEKFCSGCGAKRKEAKEEEPKGPAKKCGHCGETFDNDTDRFCSGCGAKRSGMPDEKAADEPAPQTTSHTTAPSTPKEDLLGFDDENTAEQAEPRQSGASAQEDLLVDVSAALTAASPREEEVKPAEPPADLLVDVSAEPVSAPTCSEAEPPADLLVDVSAESVSAPALSEAEPPADMLVDVPAAAATSTPAQDLFMEAFPAAAAPAEDLAPALANLPADAPSAGLADLVVDMSVAPASAPVMDAFPALALPPGAAPLVKPADDMFADFSAAPAPPPAYPAPGPAPGPAAAAPAAAAPAAGAAMPNLVFDAAPVAADMPELVFDAPAAPQQDATADPFAGLPAGAPAPAASPAMLMNSFMIADAPAAVSSPAAEDPFASLTPAAPAAMAAGPMFAVAAAPVPSAGLASSAPSLCFAAPAVAVAPQMWAPQPTAMLGAPMPASGSASADPFAQMSAPSVPAMQMPAAPAWSGAPVTAFATPSPQATFGAGLPASAPADPASAPSASSSAPPPKEEKLPADAGGFGDLFAEASTAFKLPSIAPAASPEKPAAPAAEMAEAPAWSGASAIASASLAPHAPLGAGLPDQLPGSFAPAVSLPAAAAAAAAAPAATQPEQGSAPSESASSSAAAPKEEKPAADAGGFGDLFAEASAAFQLPSMAPPASTPEVPAATAAGKAEAAEPPCGTNPTAPSAMSCGRDATEVAPADLLQFDREGVAAA